MNRLGIYIHIPFCAAKCRYCDFYSVGYDEGTASRYVDAVVNQLLAFCADKERREADTVYFGGGTPSLLREREIARVVDAVSRHMNITADCEITLELNPETATPEKLKSLRDAGINRLSVGVQSTDEKTLEILGRRHSAGQAKRAIALAHKAGFESISADIMLALPEENERALTGTLDALTALPLKHISAYMLKIADGTPFGSNPPLGIPDDAEQAGLYEYCCAYLEEKGFGQYEISNFAKTGFESRHNMKYWNCDDYLGLGAAAHSSLGGRRYSFGRDITGFIRAYDKEQSAGFLSVLDFEGEVTAEDYIMLQLRTTEGLDTNELYEQYNYKLDIQKLKLIERYRAGGFLTTQDNKIALTVKGMLVSNAIIVDLI
jgi:putative oxygen-independent coproporphyrinogen III oxidase